MKNRNHRYESRLGTAFVHMVTGDHSHVAYTEICSGEKADIAISVLLRAVSWFVDRGASVEHVLSKNGSAGKSHVWCGAYDHLGITPMKKLPLLPAPGEREDRAVPPHPRRRLGLRGAYSSETAQ